MPTYLKVLMSLLIEAGCIILCGLIGAYLGWLPMRDIPAGEAGPGDGLGSALLGILGMVVGAFVGIGGIALFWRKMHRSAAVVWSPLRPNNTGEKGLSDDKDIWPPPPNMTV